MDLNMSHTDLKGGSRQPIPFQALGSYHGQPTATHGFKDSIWEVSHHSHGGVVLILGSSRRKAG